jgi:hypothetical protein
MDISLSDFKRSASVAIFAGTLVSVVLFLGVYSTRSAFLYWPQAVGFFVCTLVRGVHTATKSDYATIAVPIDAAIYSVLLFGALRGRYKNL